MSAAARNGLGARWENFCLDLPTVSFFEAFAWPFYLYAVALIWSPDWRVYDALAAHLYKPVGLWAFTGLAWPGLAAIRVVQVAGTSAAIAALFGLRFRFSAISCFAALLLLDAWSNGFGFINVQIHFVWFAAALAFCPLDRSRKDGALRDDSASLAFRFMELATVLAYVQSGAAKLIQAGPAWALDGTTLQIGALRQGLPLGRLLAEHADLARAGSSASLLLELGFILYYPFPALRLPLFAGAVAFHLGTQFFMGISFFHLWVFSGSVLLFSNRLPRPYRIAISTSGASS